MDYKQRLNKLEHLISDMDESHPNYKTHIAEIEEIEKTLNKLNEERQAVILNAAIKTEAHAEREKILTIERRLNMNYGDEWVQWAKSLYTITSEFLVISHARSWNEPMQWQCSCQSEALERIEILIKYKQKDRERGIGNVKNDIKDEEDL